LPDRYDDGFLVLELVNATTGAVETSSSGANAQKNSQYKTVSEYYEQAPSDLRALCDALEAFLLALGDDVTKKTLKLYFAFRRIKNFACVEIHPQSRKLVVYVKVDPDDVALESGFTRDVRSVGHFGTGDLEITVASMADLERAQPLLLKSYEAS
jgi:predicted transport protein